MAKSGKAFICSSTEPVVQTKAGKVRGFIFDGTYTFHGIKYADALRFQMPTEVAPWEGVKDALSYGHVCPMLSPETAVGEIMVPHRYWPKSEHCQYLNIWSQSVDPTAKKPVLVWFHGGGFAAGSSIEQQAYDGENMSKYGDVVVVTVNHRLNILGYMDLSPFGEKYWNSGNVGNADMVASLQWVHDNISSFGGDPENVTIFGQSGGGMKVTSLMQTEAADGLFHKGVVQSGVVDRGAFNFEVKGDSTEIINKVLADLGFAADDVEKLVDVPCDKLFESYNKFAPEIRKNGGYVGGSGPVANSWYKGDPLQFGYSEHAKTIPLMVGSVLAEFAFGPGIKNKHGLSDDEINKLISDRYGAEANNLAEMFKAAYPDKHLTDLLFLDTVFRKPSIDLVEMKAEFSQSPTYTYMFAYEFPYDDGKPAWHCSEIPFVFNNSDKIPICNIPGVSDKLEAAMFGAWVAFAKSGNPNNADLAVEWPTCKPGDTATLIFDRECSVRHNFDKELVLAVRANPPKNPFGSGTVLH